MYVADSCMHVFIDPVKLIGLTSRKDFDGFGSCKGVFRSIGVELVSNRVIFNVEYSDGEFEDVFGWNCTLYNTYGQTKYSYM